MKSSEGPTDRPGYATGYAGATGITEAVFNVDTITLDKIPYGVSMALSREMLEGLTFPVEVVFRDAVDKLILELRAHVLAEKVAEQTIPVNFQTEFVWATPSSTWQMFKEEHAPDWFLKRWPVKYDFDTQTVTETKTVALEQFETFPAATIRTPESVHGGLVVPLDRMVVRG